MEIGARRATSDDLETLAALYDGLEAEMVALKDMWELADGLAAPIEESLRRGLSDPDSVVVVGTIDGVPLGLLLARREGLLVQADGEKVGAIRLIFTHPEARSVGVGEAMLELALKELGTQGVRRFDAHVLPGHRDAKNFFEAAGFAARSIVMHRPSP